MATVLAVDGGEAVRETMLPYGRQWLDDDDVAAVDKVLRSDWLTTGPNVAEFERVFADFVGAGEAVAVSNGTAALHAAAYALDIASGDEVIVPPMTFAASANCVVFQGGVPVFCLNLGWIQIRCCLIQPRLRPRLHHAQRRLSPWIIVGSRAIMTPYK